MKRVSERLLARIDAGSNPVRVIGIKMAIRVYKFKRLSRKKKEELARLIRAEIERPEQVPAPKESPVVFEVENGIPKKFKHRNIWVIWDVFKGIHPWDRSAIVSLGMGSPRDGEQLGIEMLTIAEAKNHEFGRYLLEALGSR